MWELIFIIGINWSQLVLMKCMLWHPSSPAAFHSSHDDRNRLILYTFSSRTYIMRTFTLTKLHIQQAQCSAGDMQDLIISAFSVLGYLRRQIQASFLILVLIRMWIGWQIRDYELCRSWIFIKCMLMWVQTWGHHYIIFIVCYSCYNWFTTLKFNI